MLFKYLIGFRYKLMKIHARNVKKIGKIEKE